MSSFEEVFALWNGTTHANTMILCGFQRMAELDWNVCAMKHAHESFPRNNRNGTESWFRSGYQKSDS